MSNLNSYRHFFLYAKNWYKNTDLESDLKILCNEYTGHTFNQLDDIARITLNAVKPILEVQGITTEKYLIEMLNNFSKVNCFSTEYVNPLIATIRTNLYFMAHCTIMECGELGEPDFSLLNPSREILLKEELK